MNYVRYIVLLAAGCGSAFWLMHPSAADPRAPVEVTASPVVLDAVVKEIRLETVSMRLNEVIESTRTRRVPLWGDVTVEWATYIATGTAHAGFPEGAIHLERLTGSQVAIRLDAPQLLSLEDQLHAVSHGSFWNKDLRFEEEVRARAREKLRLAACKSPLFRDANESARERIRALITKAAPQATVTIRTTEEHTTCLSA